MKTGLGSVKGTSLSLVNHFFVEALHLSWLSPLTQSYREISKASDGKSNDNWRLSHEHPQLAEFVRASRLQNFYRKRFISPDLVSKIIHL